MVLLLFFVLLVVLSRSLKLFGDRPINMVCPVSAFVNKMDRSGANFFDVVRQVKKFWAQILYLSPFQLVPKKLLKELLILLKIRLLFGTKMMFWDNL
jgi:hypothetical protein